MNSNTDRQVRAYREAANYLVLPASIEGNDYWVTKKDGTFYTVAAGTCDCPDFKKRGGKCKHIHLVELHEQAEAPAQVKPSRPALTPEREAQIRRDIATLWP